MKIAVDAMGGDHAPHEIVEGALRFVAQHEAEVILVGDESTIEPLARKSPHWQERLRVQHASETALPSLSPTEAFRKQRDSSIAVAARLLKEGRADAVVSAGNTGLTMVSALMTIGRIRGVERPAIATVVPTLKDPCVLLDVGANVDSRPNHLLQFALMGSVYSERVLGVKRPRVGLLSNGEEPEKGNEVVVAAHAKMRDDPRLNFIGNVEGRDVFAGKADVLVCDGFVGNVVLKLAEGMADTLFHLLRTAVGTNFRSRLGGALLKPTLRNMRGKLDYTEYGGALLLGVPGVFVIAHGASNAKAISNAIRVAKEAVEGQVTQLIAMLSEERVVSEL